MKQVWVALLMISFTSCAAPLRTSIAPFQSPTGLPHVTVGQLTIGVDVFDNPETLTRVFGTDLSVADVLPVHLIVENKGAEEYEIDARQIFAVADTTYYPAYTLNQTAQRVRESSIGTTVAGQAALGALAGAMAGAAIGAAAGSGSGNAGRGAAYGAALGSTMGGMSGAAAGASDSYTRQFRHELAIQDFGDRIIFGGDMHRGFLYFQRQPYTMLRVKVTNITARTTQVIEIPLRQR